MASRDAEIERVIAQIDARLDALRANEAALREILLGLAAPNGVSPISGEEVRCDDA